MPITGSLGALSYGRGQELTSWAYTLASSSVIVFSDLVYDTNTVYTASVDQFPSANFPDINGTATALKIKVDTRPEILWQKQLDPTIYQREIVSINGTTETLTSSNLEPVLPPDFVNGTPVRFFGGTFGGVVGDTQLYYLINVSGRIFQISLSPGGPPVNLTSGSGSMQMVGQVADQSRYLTKTNRLKYDSVDEELMVTGQFNSITTATTSLDGNGYYGTTTFIDSQGNFVSNFKNFRSQNQNNAGNNPYMDTADVVKVGTGEYVCTSRCNWSGTTFNKIDLLTKFDSTGSVLLQKQEEQTNLSDPLQSVLVLSTSDIIVSHQLLYTGGLANLSQLSIKSLDPSTFNVNWQLRFDWTMGKIYNIVKDSNDNIFVLLSDNTDSWLIKVNSSGTAVYQKKYDGITFQDCFVDNNDDLYIACNDIAGAGSNSLEIIKINNTAGTVDWCNRLTISNVTLPLAGLTFKVQGIVADEESVYVLTNLYNKCGVIYKFPNNGNIDGSGSYHVENTYTVYDLTYQTLTPTVTTTTFTFNTTQTALTAMTSTPNNSSFTTSTGTVEDFIGRIA